jgi:hypothetical protein
MNSVVTQLREKTGYGKTPRCESELLSEDARNWHKNRIGGRPKDLRCPCKSTYCVNGRNLCAKHAGIEALAYLMKPPERS